MCALLLARMEAGQASERPWAETQERCDGTCWTDICHLQVRHLTHAGRLELVCTVRDGVQCLMQREVSKTGGMMWTGCACPSPWMVERRWEFTEAGCLIFQDNR